MIVSKKSRSKLCPILREQVFHSVGLLGTVLMLEDCLVQQIGKCHVHMKGIRVYDVVGGFVDSVNPVRRVLVGICR